MEEKIKYSHVAYDDDKSFFFDHVHIEWDEQITYHQQEEWELSFVITGSGTRVIGDMMETFSKGEIVFIPPNLPHGWFFDKYDHDEEGKIENITIIFPDSLLDSCSVLFKELKSSISKIKQINKGLRFEGETLEYLKEMMTLMTTQTNIEQLLSLLQILDKIANTIQTQVVGFCEKQTKGAHKIREIYRYMVNNYQNNITLDEVSTYFGMNRSSFCTFFKREKGKSFFTALTEYRIECSCLMLRETNKSIAEICFASGFSDVPHFNRTFKKLKGLTPNEYRNLN